MIKYLKCFVATFLEQRRQSQQVAALVFSSLNSFYCIYKQNEQKISVMCNPKEGYFAPTYLYYIKMRLNQISFRLNWQIVASCEEMPT